MDYKEAQEWLAGNRSMRNEAITFPIEDREERIAKADAAMMQQAYWVAKAHAENLIKSR